MGKKLHLEIIFPGKRFPNVQFKPRRSTRDKHMYQVETKLAGASSVNRDLRDTRLLIGTKFSSLTIASLMSNFLMCIMDKLRVTIKERDPQSRDTRDDNNVRLIEVNHIAGAEVNPLTWYSSSKEGLVRNSMFSEGRPLPFDTWLQRIVSNLLIDKETLKIANQEIVKVATDYVASIISTATGKSIDEYQDPPHWRDKINEYLQRGHDSHARHVCYPYPNPHCYRSRVHCPS